MCSRQQQQTLNIDFFIDIFLNPRPQQKSCHAAAKANMQKRPRLLFTFGFLLRVLLLDRCLLFVLPCGGLHPLLPQRRLGVPVLEQQQQQHQQQLSL